MPRQSAFSRRAGWFCLLCPLLYGAPADGDGSVPGWNKLVYLAYRVEVTNYCGLTTERVIAGFRLQRKNLLNEYNLTPPQIQSARNEAWSLAHKEWDNRGLGGFKPWCRRDATRYAEEFVNELQEH